MQTELAAVLAPAYQPCAHLSGACAGMCWSPASGHVPRGFCGATGSLREVKLVLVVAEPGDPHPGERHNGLDSALAYTESALRDGTDLFHRNVRALIDLCFPGQEVTEQLRQTWITESVLCSASTEGGNVPAVSWRACGATFLRPQLSLFPGAVKVALGSKARDRMSALGLDFIATGAVAPPGCNRREAKANWNEIAAKVRALRGSAC